MTMNNRSGRRGGLHEVLGRSPGARGAAADHAGAGNGLVRRALAAAMVVVVALAVLATPPTDQAAAQTATTFVSNTGKSTSGSRTPGLNTYAQSFETGTVSGEYAGFALASIVLDFSSTPGSSTLTVTVREDDSGSPSSTVLYTLTNPATYATDLNEFSAPSTAPLAASTKYWVVARYDSNSGGPGWKRVLLNAGVDSGAATGWTIDDFYKERGRGSSGAWTDGATSRALKLQVKGTLRTTTTTNAAPTASDGTVTTDEDTDHTFTAANFSFADTDTGDTLSSVKIVTLPGSGKGTLELDGTAIASTALPQTVTKADIDGSKLKYSPPANANGTAYASFTFKVNDGTDDSATANTMTIDVTAVNDPATGEPTITGTAQVGQALTAVTTGIMDADGLTSVTYTYVWIRVDGSDEDDITGATSSTYTLVADDQGKTIKVKVSFTDNGGTAETRTSAATAAVAAAAATNAAPTASDGLIKFDPGFKQGQTRTNWPADTYVLEGAMQCGERRYEKDTYHYRPTGHAYGPIASPTGITRLVFSADSKTASSKEEVFIQDVKQMPFGPSYDDKTGKKKGIKELRTDPAARISVLIHSTFVPGERTLIGEGHVHDHIEEVFALAGEFEDYVGDVDSHLYWKEGVYVCRTPHHSFHGNSTFHRTPSAVIIRRGWVGEKASTFYDSMSEHSPNVPIMPIDFVE